MTEIGLPEDNVTPNSAEWAMDQFRRVGLFGTLGAIQQNQASIATTLAKQGVEGAEVNVNDIMKLATTSPIGSTINVTENHFSAPSSGEVTPPPAAPPEPIPDVIVPQPEPVADPVLPMLPQQDPAVAPVPASKSSKLLNAASIAALAIGTGLGGLGLGTYLQPQQPNNFTVDGEIEWETQNESSTEDVRTDIRLNAPANDRGAAGEFEPGDG